MSSSTILDSLKEEIDAEKRIISTITAHDYYSEEGRRKAEHIKILGKKEEEYDLILESQRVKAVLREHDELHPPATEDCPICLETIRIVNMGSTSLFSCCGKSICNSCYKDNRDREDDGLQSCPLCRAPMPTDEHVPRKSVEKHAKAGRVWAQILLGASYANGIHGYPVDKSEAFRLLKIVADKQGNTCTMSSDAFYELSYLYRDGIEDILRPCPAMEMKYLENAANLGHISGQYNLGLKYMAMGGSDNMTKAALYFTLGSSQGHIESSRMLGDFYTLGLGGLNKSVYRAKHYLSEAAEKGYDYAYHNLSCVLLELCASQYGEMVNVPMGPDYPKPGSSATLTLDLAAVWITGHSCIPRALFWLRKSVLENAMFRSQSAELIASLEKSGKEACSNCRKKTVCFPQPLKACVRCKAVWYCGREVRGRHLLFYLNVV
ncbi:hypothetical protein ACHAWF_018405 [Thalassiosira exigua]